MSYLGLEGKRALVTGGTKGVGQAVVAALREAGATALTTARSRPEGFSNAEHFVIADVSTVEGCAAVANAVRVVVHLVGSRNARSTLGAGVGRQRIWRWRDGVGT